MVETLEPADHVWTLRGGPNRTLYGYHGAQTTRTGLERKERRYRALFNDPNIPAGILDTDGTLLEVNRTAMEYLDTDIGDVLGEPFWETAWWSDEMRAVIQDKVEQAAAGEYVEYAADLTTADCEQYSVQGVVRPVPDEGGAVRSLIVSARDVTG